MNSFNRHFVTLAAESIREDMGIEATGLESDIPCIVDLKEAHTRTEEERIRHARKRMAKAFGSLIDRLIRFRPESRPYAFDAFRQEIADAKPLWGSFSCEKFRPVATEEDGGKKKQAKKKS